MELQVACNLLGWNVMRQRLLDTQQIFLLCPTWSSLRLFLCEMTNPVLRLLSDIMLRINHPRSMIQWSRTIDLIISPSRIINQKESEFDRWMDGNMRRGFSKSDWSSLITTGCWTWYEIYMEFIWDKRGKLTPDIIVIIDTCNQWLGELFKLIQKMDLFERKCNSKDKFHPIDMNVTCDVCPKKCCLWSRLNFVCFLFKENHKIYPILTYKWYIWPNLHKVWIYLSNL